MHYAGHKDTLEIAGIYDRYPELTSLENANALGASVDGDRTIRELWHFGCSEYLAEPHEEARRADRRARGEARGGRGRRQVGFRMLRPAMANEPDRDKRRALEQARNELTEEHMNPVYREAVAVTLQAVKDLGAPDAVELHRRFGFKLDELADQCRAVLADTESLFEETIEPLLRERLGISLDEAERWDIPRLFRAAEWDESFTADGMLPALECTLTGLGIDLRSQKNVELDVEQREKKSPRAFCAPIEVPDRVVLVIQPIGGVDDWRALFHEAGHTEHFALTSADLSMEERRLGDNAVTEGWATLFDHLVNDPTWLDRLLSFADPKSFTAESAAQELWFLRRYSAKLLYELELYLTDDVESMRSRYVEILGGALKVEPSPTDWLFDVDPASTAPSTSARGPSRRSCASTSARSSATTGSRRSRPARCSRSCGRSARSRRPTRCSPTSPAPASRWPRSPSAPARCWRSHHARCSSGSPAGSSRSSSWRS